MKHPQFMFFQGSTPTLCFAIPYEIGEGDKVYATFSQDGKTVTEYTCNGTAYDPAPGGSLAPDEDNAAVLRISMTQADTFLFAEGDCEMQLRVLKTGERADTLFPVHGYVGAAQKGTVIS